jgi:hypothetical protein
VRIASAALLTATVLLPARLNAQVTAGITGVVRDTTGAVLPGVTVEASSPALIEKVRTATTDGQGRYNITDLRPGTYTVTFTLAGFGPAKIEGVSVSAGFTGTANAELKVGGLEESVTVTGGSPVVDIQNVRTQQVLKTDVLDALPSGQRDLGQYAGLTLGAQPSSAGRNDVGGNMGESSTGITIHGSRGDEGRINYDGMNTNVFYATGGGQQRIWKFNTIGVQEVVVDTGGASAETETGAANVNMVPRDGSNNFTIHSILNYTNNNLSSGKVPDAAIARGSAPNSNGVKRVFDYGVGVGGPIVKDRLWFYSANRYWGSDAYGANLYYNKSTVFYQYVPDLSRPASTNTETKDFAGRFTWQVNAKNKINTNLNWQQACYCFSGISFGSPVSPEAATSFVYGQGHGMWLSQTSWTSPVTNKLLFDAAASFLVQAVSFTNQYIPGPTNISILERTTGFRWGALAGGFQGGSYDVPHAGNNFGQRASVSYITGSHSFKTGLQTLQGVYDTHGNALPNGVDYTFSSGVPFSLTEFTSPYENHTRIRGQAVFAQDQWTIHRVTLNLGLRYDHFTAFVLPITLPAGPFTGSRSYPGVNDLPNYNDLSPRVGASFDVFGNGKTAVKASWGRYLAGLGGGDAQSLAPAATVNISTDRLWTDTNGNFVPDCNLTNPAANGECGPILNPGFGQARSTTQWADSARRGWGVREFAYQYSVALQHELRQGLGLTVGYYRSDWRNKQAIVNNAVTPADYTSFCITAPSDSRLGSFSGTPVCGIYDQNPGPNLGLVNAQRVRVQDIAGRTGDPKDTFNGVDVGMNARFGAGGLITGGVTVGRSMFDFCWQNNLPNVQQIGTPTNLPRSANYCKIQSSWWDGVGSQIKLQVVYPLPYQFVISGSYKNLPGIPLTASYVMTAPQEATALGRPRTGCWGTGLGTCTASPTVALLPSATIGAGNTSSALLDQRLNETDLRLTRNIKITKWRIQAIAELYNIFNNRPVQGIVTTYGASWELPTALLGGRLFKFGTQIDF